MTGIEFALQRLVVKLTEIGFDDVKKNFQDNGYISKDLVPNEEAFYGDETREIAAIAKEKTENNRLIRLNKETLDVANATYQKSVSYTPRMLVANGIKKYKKKRKKR
ncbi:MAG: hypothetical protein A3F91_09380 [Flavobacteria bacterium RIFCSPLOWO2_12_FULL_35_11]|nr:MAG: hypothetical protein A3F91_09380 [Flavobacteria bacterium RIFCSPLOWO2_12_FULL_35_11]